MPTIDEDLKSSQFDVSVTDISKRTLIDNWQSIVEPDKSKSVNVNLDFSNEDFAKPDPY